jgi:hypothetical protein
MCLQAEGRQKMPPEQRPRPGAEAYRAKKQAVDGLALEFTPYLYRRLAREKS